MFKPNYTITNKLLSNIKQISSIVLGLNNKRFSKVVLFELEKNAREISTYASTSIEGNPLPLTDVKSILKNQPQNLRNSEQEVINYNKALEELNEDTRRGQKSFSLDLILSIHKEAVYKLISKYQCGKLREEPVFVNNPKTGSTVYWPPDFKDVTKFMNDLISFVIGSKGVIDPLIIAGIFHKQFVIIHPFMDGNGRAARLSTKVLLADMGLNTFNLFSLENEMVFGFFSINSEEDPAYSYAYEDRDISKEDMLNLRINYSDAEEKRNILVDHFTIHNEKLKQPKGMFRLNIVERGQRDRIHSVILPPLIDSSSPEILDFIIFTDIISKYARSSEEPNSGDLVIDAPADSAVIVRGRFSGKAFALLETVLEEEKLLGKKTDRKQISGD